MLVRCTTRIQPSEDPGEAIPLFDLLQTCLPASNKKVCVYLFMLLSLLLLFHSERIGGVYVVIARHTSEDRPAWNQKKIGIIYHI